MECGQEKVARSGDGEGFVRQSPRLCRGTSFQSVPRQSRGLWFRVLTQPASSRAIRSIAIDSFRSFSYARSRTERFTHFTFTRRVVGSVLRIDRNRFAAAWSARVRLGFNTSFDDLFGGRFINPYIG